ncbi:7103_t:CDS:2 [Funneliformis caledonium]|uniref:7103_t:CDS:1 n=1 Tax=Funneliformis caledonium TaxID=1117310 RepID=A0A9N8V4D4_9GLOM|nr:7103_t:CDS:2 [Funneliformis caledonium]
MAVHPISQTAAHFLHRSKKLVSKLNKRQGETYLFGRAGEPKDEKKAFEFFQRAASLKHPESQGVMAFCYEFGLGIEKDFKQAELHYIPAAELGNGLAQARLAFLRKYGRPSVHIDRAEAEMWQQKVKDQGKTAIAWLFYAASAAQNHARAQDKLGVCLQLGIGCEKDEETAFQNFLKAAEQDHLTAMYHLANALEKGIGCDANLEGATHWFERAASSGCRTSCERLKRLLVKECLGQEASGNIYLSGYYAAAA